MLDLQLPWWEFVLRTAVVYVCLMLMVRLSGKRTVGPTAWMSSRSERMDAVLQGKPTLIGRDGVIDKGVLKRARVPYPDFGQTLRAADCAIEDMRCAFLEADGNISILKRQG